MGTMSKIIASGFLGGANPWVGSQNLLFDNIVAENYMKMKEIGPPGGGGVPAPIGSTNDSRFTGSPTQFLDPLLYFHLEVFTFRFCASYFITQ